MWMKDRLWSPDRGHATMLSAGARKRHIPTSRPSGWVTQADVSHRHFSRFILYTERSVGRWRAGRLRL